MSGNFPEEDGVDHRVEPQSWLTDGDAETTAPEPDAFGPDYGLNPDGPGSDNGDAATPASLNGAPGLPASTIAAPDSTGSGLAAGPPAAWTAPPFPANVAPPTPAAKVTAPFSILTRTRGRTKPAKPARPVKQARPAKPAKTARPASNQKKAPPRPQEPRLAQGVPGTGGSTRKAQLVLSRVEPWSVMKFSFMISLVGWVVLFVAVAGIYFVLSKIGVFTSIESTIGQVTSSKGHPGSNAASWFAASRVLGYTMLAGAINIVLITALATVGAVVYNLVTHLAGGIEVTLKATD